MGALISEGYNENVDWDAFPSEVSTEERAASRFTLGIVDLFKSFRSVGVVALVLHWLLVEVPFSSMSDVTLH